MARLLLSNLNESNNLTCFITNCFGGDPFPPPFPSPPLDADPDSSIPIDVHHSNRMLPNFLIATSSLLALSFLLLLLFYSLLRFRRRRLRLQHGSNPQPPPHNPDLIYDDADDDWIHHVWFIRTVGLDESIIEAIPAMVCTSGSNGNCSVCLGELTDGEVVKLLPKCAHVFHVACIDTWLRSHVNCPLCRAAVVVDLVGVSESARIEIGGENQEACLDMVDSSNLTSSSSRGEVKNGSGNGNEDEDDFQPIRRSVSMDASSLGMIMLRVELDSADGKSRNGRREVELRGVGVCRSTDVKGDDNNLGKLGSELKRSMSSRSGRLFFSRLGQVRSTSVVMNGGGG